MISYSNRSPRERMEPSLHTVAGTVSLSAGLCGRIVCPSRPPFAAPSCFRLRSLPSSRWLPTVGPSHPPALYPLLVPPSGREAEREQEREAGEAGERETAGLTVKYYGRASKHDYRTF